MSDPGDMVSPMRRRSQSQQTQLLLSPFMLAQTQETPTQTPETPTIVQTQQTPNSDGLSLLAWQALQMEKDKQANVREGDEGVSQLCEEAFAMTSDKFEETKPSVHLHMASNRATRQKTLTQMADSSSDSSQRVMKIHLFKKAGQTKDTNSTKARKSSRQTRQQASTTNSKPKSVPLSKAAKATVPAAINRKKRKANGKKPSPNYVSTSDEPILNCSNLLLSTLQSAPRQMTNK